MSSIGAKTDLVRYKSLTSKERESKYVLVPRS